jgi:hypothetical protein
VPRDFEFALPIVAVPRSEARPAAPPGQLLTASMREITLYAYNSMGKPSAAGYGRRIARARTMERSVHDGVAGEEATGWCHHREPGNAAAARSFVTKNGVVAGSLPGGRSLPA